MAIGTTILHFSVGSDGRARFGGEVPSGDGGTRPVSGDGILETAVRRAVWAGGSVIEEKGGESVVVDDASALMFLSDVRERRLCEGLFLGNDVLEAARIFREAARTVADGLYLPDVEEKEGRFFARWRPVGPDGGGELFRWVVDALARRAGRTVLETGGRAETLHDAWTEALRSDDGEIRWPDAEASRDFAVQLRAWRSPLAVSRADRAALRFTLSPPKKPDGSWQLSLASVPSTGRGLKALGQAAALFPPLAHMQGTTTELPLPAAEEFMRGGAAALSAAGFDVVLPEGVLGEHVSAEAEVDPAPAQTAGRTAKVQAKLTVRVDGEAVGEEELAFLLDQRSSFVFFRNRWIEVDRGILREALKAVRAAKGREMTVRDAVAVAFGMRKVNGMAVARLNASGWLRGLLNGLRGDDRFREIPVPEGFRGKLRDYQLRGASWMAFLAKWGFGACLADDMGLGKTVQTIAFLLHRRADRPALVVAPVSVTANWMRELAKFAPGMKTMLHQGPERAGEVSFAGACAEVDAVVTGYATFVRDYRLFAEVEFSALVLDEAQMVKNPDTRVSRAVRSLDVPVRVALTGTPLENSVQDLWAIEDFLNPGLLGPRKEFVETFARPLQDGAGSSAAARLRRTMEPFMLRRLKSDPGVAAELGAKREVREWCRLSPGQRIAYEAALAAYREDMTEGADARGRRGKALALLTRLKLVCDGEGKMERLEELLDSIFAAGESCLVFTQYAKVGVKIRARLLERFGRSFPFLHGGLVPAAREREIAAFNADPEPCAFILSLRAGGFGLNLVKATHVVHFDRWWNPAVENQATDRAHRIGQKNDVLVHLFMSAGTVEEHVDDLLEKKRRIAGEIVGGGERFLLQMGAEEFERTVGLDER